MTLDQFRDSLSRDHPPEGLDLALAGLWWDAKGDLTKAHESAQQEEGPPGSWVHAYLHRKELVSSRPSNPFRRKARRRMARDRERLVIGLRPLIRRSSPAAVHVRASPKAGCSYYHNHMSISPELVSRQAALQQRLASLGRLLVAYSGGVDSAYLAWEAHRQLGSDMLAVIADSPSLARTHLADAISFAAEQKIPLQVIQTLELDRPEYVLNDGSRCFHCKDELFDVMEAFREANGFTSIAYGVNVDDQGDFRPGQVAARQHYVAAPLLDARLTKQDIRDLARAAGLRVWDKPASACLSSRIEYGRPVTREALSVIESGEDALRELGFRQFRVRHHGDIVRIEVAKDELPRALDPAMASELTRIFKALGFKFVTLDLEGFRSGSMNSLLPVEDLRRAG